MKLGKWVRWILAAAPLGLAGCGNFWQDPYTTSSTCTTTCPTTASGNFYVLNEGTNQIAAYNIASGGTLTAISGSPYTLAAKPLSLAIAPSGSYLYVGTAAGVYMYTIDTTTGQLTVGSSGQPIDTADLATTMQIDPSGAWLVWGGTSSTGDVSGALPLDTSTGLRGTGTEQYIKLAATTVEQLAISSDGDNVFVALGAGGTEVIPFTAANAAPFGTTATTIAVKKTGGSALSVAVDPQTRLFYIGETLATTGSDPGGLRVFNYASLATKPVTEVSGSPYASGGLQPTAILPDASGDYVYVSNGLGSNTAGNLAGFTIDTSGSTYSLTAGSTVGVGIAPAGLAEDSSDTYVLAVASGGSPDLAAFSFDTTTLGKLDSVLTASTGTDPVQAAAIVAAVSQ
jgi:6-phosphogluconolactonase